MPRITVAEAQAWAESSKFTIPTSGGGSSFTAQDTSQLEQIEEEILAKIANAYDTSDWTDENTTPRLVRVAIAKKFVAWAYRRQYSESLGDVDASYSALLEANASSIIDGIVDGTIEIPDEGGSNIGPVFYPTDASSALEPTRDDPSLGPAKFSMGLSF